MCVPSILVFPTSDLSVGGGRHSGTHVLSAAERGADREYVLPYLPDLGDAFKTVTTYRGTGTPVKGVPTKTYEW